MRHWHYELIVWTGSFGGVPGERGIVAMLKQMGDRGWELVTVVPEGEAFRYIFKQPAEG